MQSRLRRDLTAAMKRRDNVTVAALRSALAAIANAEAVEAISMPDSHSSQSEIAGAVVGLGAAEVPRRHLTAADVAEIIRTEVTERRAAAEHLAQAHQHAHAERLRAEATVLARYLKP